MIGDGDREKIGVIKIGTTFAYNKSVNKYGSICIPNSTV
jgi:hypothetical protein